MVLGGKGMPEGQMTLLHGMLHCWTAADGVCDLLQATFGPPAASESSLQHQLKDGLQKIKSSTEVKSC